MKAAFLFLAVTLSGCAGWQKPGATSQDLARDRFACEQQAAAMYPAAMVTQGGYQAPMRTNCSTYGNTTRCTTEPGQYIAGPTVDANLLPRSEAIAACMRANGWR